MAIAQMAFGEKKAKINLQQNFRIYGNGLLTNYVQQSDCHARKSSLLSSVDHTKDHVIKM
jgi:hypothetical protein